MSHQSTFCENHAQVYAKVRYRFFLPPIWSSWLSGDCSVLRRSESFKRAGLFLECWGWLSGHRWCVCLWLQSSCTSGWLISERNHWFPFLSWNPDWSSVFKPRTFIVSRVDCEKQKLLKTICSSIWSKLSSVVLVLPDPSENWRWLWKEARSRESMFIMEGLRTISIQPEDGKFIYRSGGLALQIWFPRKPKGNETGFCCS